MMSKYAKSFIPASDLSFGQNFHGNQSVISIDWVHELHNVIEQEQELLLPHGGSLSYNDCALNQLGSVISCKNLDRVIHFDRELGVITVQPGITFQDVLKTVIPQGWFVPVSPGSQYVTIGGAVANDVHGKNHHHEGSFGHFVLELTLLTSSGQYHHLTPDHPLFRSTIGGLGLTGLITSITFQLIKQGAQFDVEHLEFSSPDDYLAILEASNSDHYTVSWLDMTSKKFRGIFMRGNSLNKSVFEKNKSIISFPKNPSLNLINQTSVCIFNQIYFSLNRKKGKRVLSYDQFFYPLDRILHWNRVYGKKGLCQLQFVLPREHFSHIVDFVQELKNSWPGSFLAVLKELGDKPSIGPLSFSMPGITFAVDFPYHDSLKEKYIKLCEKIISLDGKIYLAKDRFLNPEMFKCMYPKWKEFSNSIDSGFSSNLWRRVTNG